MVHLKRTDRRGWPNDRSWHECDIVRSRIDFRFRGKNGHAADITSMTEFDPEQTLGVRCEMSCLAGPD
jgi:hypothetical protein